MTYDICRQAGLLGWVAYRELLAALEAFSRITRCIQQFLSMLIFSSFEYKVNNLHIHCVGFLLESSPI